MLQIEWVDIRYVSASTFEMVTSERPLSWISDSQASLGITFPIEHLFQLVHDRGKPCGSR